MSFRTVSPMDAIAYLNSLVDLDRGAISALIENRVPANDELADHPTCQVQMGPDGPVVGLLGVINGLFGVDEHGYGAIAACFEEDGTFIKFAPFNKEST